MASGDHKNWWETNLDWNLSGSLQETVQAGQRMIRNIPAAMTAHHLGKQSPVDSLEPDPVERMAVQERPGISVAERRPRMMEAPPKPACLQKKLVNSQSIKLRAVNIPPPLKATPPVKAKSPVTLEQLLDPDFCDY